MPKQLKLPEKIERNFVAEIRFRLLGPELLKTQNEEFNLVRLIVSRNNQHYQLPILCQDGLNKVIRCLEAWQK